jgi:hypothetical protein
MIQLPSSMWTAGCPLGASSGTQKEQALGAYVDTDFGAVNTAMPVSLFRAWNYGLAGFDRTNILKLNRLWDIPNWKSAIAPVGAVVDD